MTCHRAIRSRVAPEADLRVLDIVDGVALDAVVEEVGPRAVYHLAAQASVVASVQDPVRDCHVNVVGTLNVVEAAGKVGAPVVFTSTGGALYGDGVPMRRGRTRSRSRSPPTGGASKLAAESYVGTWSRSSGIAHAVCRLGNVYGPRQNPHGEAGRWSRSSPITCTPRARPRYTGRASPRATTCTSPMSSARCSPPRARPGPTTSRPGVETDVLTIWQRLSNAAGKQVEPRLADLRPGELQHSRLDIARAEQELGWRPRVPIEEGLKLTYAALVEELEQS